ncbi:diguanylate cyclase [Nitrincola iocasae]|uniref:Diguanylate cyclase n=1 Tax=Nitrincola iocasae TaxID=2614693 RepID=A0A5J6LIK0_9GAMM|nr:diguanylate cyclase [Nitrincola iocasae]QEW08136.1 diguanylate cyclase [Nitrincola iocasae]
MQYWPNFCPRRLTVLLVFALLGLLAFPALANETLPVQPSKNILHFGVFSYLGNERTEAKYAPLIAYLNTVLVTDEVVLHVLPQDELNRRIRDGEIDLVTTNPTHFLLARTHYPLTGVIATLVESDDGRPVYRLGGAIVAAADRQDINTLQDIKNKRVAAPSRENLGGYRSQAYELFLAGIRLPDDIQELQELGTHHEAVRAVMDGRADVAFVRDGILEQMQRNGQLQEQAVKLINPQFNSDFTHQVSTRLYPEWPVFALPHVNDRTIRHVAAALFSLDPEHPAAQQAGIYGFTVPADYLPVEAMARALRLPPFENIPDFTLMDAWERWRGLLLIVMLATLVILTLSLSLAWHWGKAHIERVRFKTLLQGLGEGVYGVNRQGECTFINQAALRMLQVTSSQALGQDQHRLFHHHYQNGKVYPHADCPIVKTLEDGRQRQQRDWFIRYNGGSFPVEMTVTPLFSKDRINGAVVAFSDITQRVRAEQENKRLTEYNRMLLESAGDGIYGCDMHGLCTFINPAALTMLGFEYQDVIGKDQHRVFHYCYPDGSAYHNKDCPVHQTLAQGKLQECEDHFVRSSGDTFPVHMKVSPVFEEREQVGAVVVFQDITKQKAMEQQLIALTTTDDLTGLHNRRYFQMQLKKEFLRYQRSFADNAVLMIDLDHFKRINDNFGHAAGDKVLREFGALLMQQRSSDLSARVGGEEFALLLPDTSLKDAITFANRFREQVAVNVFQYEQQSIPLTVSIGCTLMSPDDTRPDMSLARADRALYQAKESGRNRVVAFS